MKVWFTIMVVFIHSYGEEFSFQGAEIVQAATPFISWMKYVFSRVISNCAVPGFFFLSAVFLFRKDFNWKDNVKKKLRTLLIPYFILNTVWIGIYFAAQHIGFLRGFFSDPSNFVAGWTWKDWLSEYAGVFRGRMNPFVGPLWFMRDLFLMNLLAPVLKKMIDKAPRAMMLLLAVTLVFSNDQRYPVLRQFALLSFCLGYYAVKYDWHFGDADRVHPLPLAMGYLFVIILTCFTRDSRFYLVTNTVTVLVGFLFFVRCTTKIKNHVWKDQLLRLSGYGVPVYLFHERTLYLTKKAMARVLPTTAVSNILQYFGTVCLIIFLCVIAAKLMERSTPKIYGILTGGR